MVEEGQAFPDFSLLDQDGKTVTLADLKGRKTIIYFYPKDDTPGCTTEACNFRDALESIPHVNLLGVSPDDVKSHRKFVDKYSLGFSLLSDPSHTLSESLGVWVEKSMYGKKYMGVDRTTFVLDENGTVQKIFRKVKPAGHADEVRAVL